MDHNDPTPGFVIQPCEAREAKSPATYGRGTLRQHSVLIKPLSESITGNGFTKYTKVKQPLSFQGLQPLHVVLDIGGTDRISVDQHTVLTMSSPARLVRNASTQRALRSAGTFMIKLHLLDGAHGSFRWLTTENCILAFIRAHRFPSS